MVAGAGEYHCAIVQDEAPFVPRGAVAFFAALIVLYAAVWILLEMVLITRA